MIIGRHLEGRIVCLEKMDGGKGLIKIEPPRQLI
jgi:hypothetical protein